MKKYDVSVVVPVYNCGKYIEKCIKSIEDQDYERLDKIQVILVDDGSTDNSLEICNQLKERISDFNIEIITGDNEGVSSARNKGIEAASGKYIMFIDADDFISRNAIKKIVEFFDEHYDEIDLVTYPVYEYNVDTKKKKILERYKDFGKTQVYDLEKDYWAIQPTMNVVIKNLFDNNILFKEDLFFHEDLIYNTEIVMKKLKLGYIKKIKYYYRIYENSATNYKENPLYCFEQYMYVFEYLFNKYKDEEGKIPFYVQRIVLNVIRYRILKDKLFPYYLNGEEYKIAYHRLINIIKQIDDENIVLYGKMDNYHKEYLISLKDEKVTIYNNFKSFFTINNNDNILLTENKVTVVLSRFKFKNGKVQVLGFLKSLLLRYITPEMYINYITNDGEEFEEKLELSDTVASRYKTQIDVAKFYKFEYELDIKNIKNFKFKVKINDTDVNVGYYFNTWSSFNSSVKSYKIYSGKYRIQFKKNSFDVRTPNKKTRRKDFVRAIKRYSKINYKINIYRTLAKLENRKKENIWLYYDRKNVFDNAYSQFKHDINIKDDIKKYYVLDGKIENFKDKFNKKELNNVIKFGSLKHKILYLNSDKILTSFSSLQEYCPFYKNYQYYKDILKYDLIYLQHGILHAKLLKMYSKTFTPIDKFVVSSQFEKENLIKNYEYNENDLICCGMPRLDDKNDENVEPENKIIFAPSWREYLIGKAINRKRKINKEKFINSKYYIETVKFLTNKNLLKVLKEKNIVIDYKLHPIFEKYKECFDHVICDNITVSIGNTNLSKCKAFITDFSSFQFDFVKLVRPIVYFVPDMDEFKAGLHTYRELDLKHEDAFGKLCLTGDELLKEIIKLIDNNFEMDELYKERMENFFFKVDNRKEKLYQAIKNY